MAKKKPNPCPVTPVGCPPVIRLTTDMKWVVRGAHIAIVHFLAFLLLVGGIAVKAYFDHAQPDAVANTEIVENAHAR